MYKKRMVMIYTFGDNSEIPVRIGGTTTRPTTKGLQAQYVQYQYTAKWAFLATRARERSFFVRYNPRQANNPIPVQQPVLTQIRLARTLRTGSTLRLGSDFVYNNTFLQQTNKMSTTSDIARVFIGQEEKASFTPSRNRSIIYTRRA